MVAHELGETTISGTPERVVVLEFSFVDTLAAVGVKPVGIADENEPERIMPVIRDQIGDYTSVGTRAQPSLEVITSLEPDLIIADLQRHKDIYDDLSDIAPTIVLDSLGASYQETIESARVIGEALGQADVINDRIAQHEQTMADLKAQIQADESRAMLTGVAAKDSFTLHTDSAFAPAVLTKLGLPYVQTAPDAESYEQISLEQLVQINPDVMFIITYADQTIVDEWASSDLWQGLTAVKNGQVYEVDWAVWSLGRGLLAAEEIGKDVIKLLYSEQ